MFLENHITHAAILQELSRTLKYPRFVAFHVDLQEVYGFNSYPRIIESDSRDVEASSLSRRVGHFEARPSPLVLEIRSLSECQSPRRVRDGHLEALKANSRQSVTPTGHVLLQFLEDLRMRLA